MNQFEKDVITRYREKLATTLDELQNRATPPLEGGGSGTGGGGFGSGASFGLSGYDPTRRNDSPAYTYSNGYSNNAYSRTPGIEYGRTYTGYNIPGTEPRVVSNSSNPVSASQVTSRTSAVPGISAKTSFAPRSNLTANYDYGSYDPRITPNINNASSMDIVEDTIDLQRKQSVPYTTNMEAYGIPGIIEPKRSNL